ncbi:MAG TPA: lipocalin-like domain-containing protein [Chthoniobacterales bacterium]|nr:lipocalin-like domain-containing protein [Chthoniobacterales bacterium]
MAADWKTAQPGWHYEFPRDHGPHREFKTEWWYFTGNLFDSEGHRFGYELTFFRHGIQPADKRDPNVSRFIVDDLKFAHFAITDVSGKTFRFQQKMSRGAFGEAGFGDATRLAFIDDWSLTATGDREWAITATSDSGAIRLQLRFAKDPVIHGENGVSVKAAGGASASHYYSIPRLETSGELTLFGKTRPVQGDTWFDHEWSSSQLGRGEIGWDWLCLQFDDGAELMLYRMRLETGEVEPSSSGTWIEADGTALHLRAPEFKMTPTEIWKSKASRGRYPIEWRVEVPGKGISLTVKPVLEDQELKLGPITYWEGAVDATASRAGKTVRGRGYLELTGYAGQLNEALRNSR